MPAPRSTRLSLTGGALATIAASALIASSVPALAVEDNTVVAIFETSTTTPVLVPADAPLPLNPDGLIVFAQAPPPEKLASDPFGDLPLPDWTEAASAVDLSGHGNGQVPLEDLCELPWASSHHLQCQAVADLSLLNAAYRSDWGADLVITDTYRSYEGQVSCRERKGTLCATPGTSNHGWGLAVDFGGGIHRFDSPQHEWMVDHAGEFGWYLPRWAQKGGANPEAWHWQHRPGIDALVDAGVIGPES